MELGGIDSAGDSTTVNFVGGRIELDIVHRHFCFDRFLEGQFVGNWVSFEDKQLF